MFNFLNIILIAGVLVSAPLVPPQVKDVQSLSDYMREKFTYKAEPEGEDVWQIAEETKKLKTFDCEDASFFSEKVLIQLGYEAYSIAIVGRNYGHAICVFKINGKWQYISNGNYSHFNNFESVKDIVKFLNPNWYWYATINLPHTFKDRIWNK